MFNTFNNKLESKEEGLRKELAEVRERLGAIVAASVPFWMAMKSNSEMLTRLRQRAVTEREVEEKRAIVRAYSYYEEFVNITNQTPREEVESLSREVYYKLLRSEE